MYLMRRFSKLTEGRGGSRIPRQSVSTALLSEPKFWTTHSEPADVAGGWITIHKRLLTVAKLIGELQDITQTSGVESHQIGLMQFGIANSKSNQQAEGLVTVELETWANVSLPGLKCEGESGMEYHFIPITALSASHDTTRFVALYRSHPPGLKPGAHDTACIANVIYHRRDPI